MRVNEIWNDIKGYEGLYQVSSLGRVKALQRAVPCKRWGTQIKSEIILNIKPKVNGYCYASLSLNGKVTHYRVHRLVAAAFMPDSVKEVVNHKDGNKSNNRVDNLEWATNSENCRHKVDVLRKQVGADCSNAKLVLDTYTGIYYDTLKEACNAKGSEYKQTSAVLSGVRVKPKTSLVYV